MKTKSYRFAALMALGIATTPLTALAETKAHSLQSLNNSIKAIVDTLVEKKVIDREQADKIIADAEKKAQSEAFAPQVVEEAAPVPGEKVIRVPYVPEHVKQQIKEEIRSGLREDTVEAVLAQAKQERWGMPGVTPEWVDRIKWKGDMRLRLEQDSFAQSNSADSYLDFQEINRAGGVGKAGVNAFMNTTEDRQRLRMRARLGMDAKVTEAVKAGFRLTTGSISDPV